MRIITAKSETNVADLVRHAYAIHGRKSAELTRQAHAALVAANPHLHEQTKVPAGTLVVVPDVPGVGPYAPEAPAAAVPEVVAQLKRALVEAKAVLERAAVSEAAETQATLDLAKQIGHLSVLKQAMDLRNRLPELVKRAKSTASDAAALRAAQEQALAELEAELTKPDT